MPLHETEAAALVLWFQQLMEHCLHSKRSLTKDCPTPVRAGLIQVCPKVRQLLHLETEISVGALGRGGC